MVHPINHPLLVFAFSFAALIFSVWFGGFFRRRRMQEGDAREYGVEETSTLTLLSLLPAAETSKLQALMQEYVDPRIAFYVTRDHDELALINAKTSQLQSRIGRRTSTLWPSRCTRQRQNPDRAPAMRSSNDRSIDVLAGFRRSRPPS